MPRKSKYTPEQKKMLKHYRNQIYYYGKRLAEYSFKYDFDVTFENIRSQIGHINSPNPLIDIFNDPILYYDTDFRQVAIDEGGTTRSLIDRISRDLGYGSIEQYEARSARETQLKSRLDEAVEAYELIRKIK